MESLNSEIVKKLHIMRTLLDEEESWINANELSTKLGIGIFSTREMLKKIVADIDFYKLDFEVEVQKQKGVRVKKFGYEEYFSYKEILLKNTLEYSLISNFFFKRAINYSQYCEEKYISLPTLRRKMTDVNRSLEKYGVRLWKNTILGDERAVRSFLAQYYYEIHGNNQWAFSSSEYELLFNIINQTERMTGIKLTESSKGKLCYLWWVSKVRREKNQYIQKSLIECKEFCKDNRYFYSFKNILKNYIASNEFFEFEAEYLFYSFFSMNIDYYNISPLKIDEISKQLMKQDCQYSLIAHRFLTTLETMLYTENLSTNKDILQIEIYSFCQFAWVFPKRLVINRDSLSKDYILDIKIKYPKMSEILEYFHSQIPNDEEFDYQYILEYLAMVVHAYKGLSHFGRKVRLTVSSSLGNIHENVLMAFILHRFKTEYNLDFVTLDNNPDIIITDNHLMNHPTAQILILNHHTLKSTDYRKLESWINAV